MELTPSFADVFQVPPTTRFVNHGHSGLHLCAILSGAFIETLPRNRTLATTGMLRISPSARHDISFGPDGARCLLVEVGGEDADALRRLPRVSEFVSDPWLARLGFQLEQAITVGKSGLTQDLVLEILAQMSRRETGRPMAPAPEWLRASRDRLADEWRNPPSAASLATAAGVHRVHLVRAFRDHFGCTLRGYVRRRRVARATDLLIRTDIPLSRVAQESGFADQAHLTRVVRRATGATPLSLRTSARQGVRVTSVQYLRTRAG